MERIKRGNGKALEHYLEQKSYKRRVQDAGNRISVPPSPAPLSYMNSSIGTLSKNASKASFDTDRPMQLFKARNMQ